MHFKNYEKPYLNISRCLRFRPLFPPCTWQHHINDVSTKVNRASVPLIRANVSPKILRPIYFASFDSHLSYCCLVWTQTFSSIKRILILQKMTVRIINLQPRNSKSVPYSSKILS